MELAFIGEIRLFPYDFAPVGWAVCDGSLLPINANPALFTLLGTSFGGDGQTNFAVPDLRSKVPFAPGQQGSYFICIAGGTFPSQN